MKSKSRVRSCKQLVAKYGPAEILGTVAAMAWGYGVYHLTWDKLLAGIAWAWAENIGYYSYNCRVERRSQSNFWHRGWKRIWMTIVGVLTEFGVGEAFDSLLVRPACMYFATVYIQPYGLWLLIWKIAADVVFYVPTTIAYRLKFNFQLRKKLTILEEKIEKMF